MKTMKSQFRIALLSAIVLASPMLSFAGGQPKIHPYSSDDGQDRAGVTRTFQQGKGSGITRSESVQVNASREQKPAESQVAKEKAKSGNPNYGDAAFHK